MKTATNEDARRSKQIAGLDVLRFLAAMLIVFHHFGWRLWYGNDGVQLNYHYFEPYARPGFVGVEIFFVLSGFVIAYSASHASAKNFALNRAIRLYPAAWICSTITVLSMFALGHGDSLLQGAPFSQHLLPIWINSLTLWPRGPWVDGAYWTLGVEIGFYLQIFLLLVSGMFRWVGVWMTLIGVLNTLSLAWVVRVGLHGTQSRFWGHYAGLVSDRASVMFTLMHHGCYFAIGVLLWLLLLHRFTWPRVAALLAMLPAVVLEIRLRVEWTGQWIVPLCIWLTGMAAIVFSVVFNEQIQALLGKRGLTITRRLGLVTYPLYLVHATAGTTLILALKPFLPDLLNFALVTFFVVFVSYCINRYLEEPLQRWLRAKLLHAARPPATIAATAP